MGALSDVLMIVWCPISNDNDAIHGISTRNEARMFLPIAELWEYWEIRPVLDVEFLMCRT